MTSKAFDPVAWYRSDGWKIDSMNGMLRALAAEARRLALRETDAGRTIGLDEHYRVVRRELAAQEARMLVRAVIARREDGMSEVLNIIQTVTDDGIVVYVAAPNTSLAAEAAKRQARKDAEICRGEVVDSFSSGAEEDAAYNQAVEDCAQAIEKEAGL